MGVKDWARVNTLMFHAHGKELEKMKKWVGAEAQSLP